jgi:hypothetical protein
VETVQFGLNHFTGEFALVGRRRNHLHQKPFGKGGQPASVVREHRGTRTPIMAINGYEKAMVKYGFAARRSAWFGHIIVSNNRLLRRAFKAAMRIAACIPPLERRMFKPTM